MKAAIYARYSPDLQRPTSIEDQVRRCRQEIARRGWEEAALFSDSETPGTVSLGRSGYQRLQEGVRQQQFDGVVVDEISRLVQWIAKGKLVEDLETEMMAAEARRDHLRRQLAQARAAQRPMDIDVLPAAVRRIVSDLRRMLAAGQVEKVKSALSRLVARIEVHEDPRPGWKRPGAKRVVRGSLEALLRLTGKAESVGSPGGILPGVAEETPPQVYVMRGRGWYGTRVASKELNPRQASAADMVAEPKASKCTALDLRGRRSWNRHPV